MSVVAQRRLPMPAAPGADWLEPIEAADSGVHDSTGFRRSVSRFATGVVVLTCEDHDGHVHGATVNSFTSVSLSPPTVLSL